MYLYICIKNKVKALKVMHRSRAKWNEMGADRDWSETSQCIPFHIVLIFDLLNAPFKNNKDIF